VCLICCVGRRFLSYIVYSAVKGGLPPRTKEGQEAERSQSEKN
jgi:hypothetical protein